MSGLLATRTARRRGIVYVSLLTATLVLMAASSSGPVRELQNGIGFAFRPIQGALADVARGTSSIADAIAEIDRLRLENQSLRQDNERLRTNQARADEI